VAGFLARYREPTLSAYRRDLRCFWQWCAEHQLEPLTVRRPHLELYLRELEQRGYAPATVSRRLSTVAGLFKYAVIDELVTANPTRGSQPSPGAMGRAAPHRAPPARVRCRAQRRPPPQPNTAHALVALLGMLRLRVSEACNAHVEDLRYAGGYELLRVLGKGAKPAEIPLPIPVLRAVKAAIEGRTHGPILLSATGTALTRAAASRLLLRVVREAGVTSPASPHTLRRTFCTAGLISGVPLRDMQYAMRHADARTTIRYDMARANLDRHAAHSVAAYLAGMAIG